MIELAPADRLALTELVAAYAVAVDNRNWEALAQAFTEDAVLVTPDPPRSMEPVVESIGRTAIVATVQQVAVFASTSHLLESSTWTGGDDTARGTSIGEAHHVVDGPEPHSWVWRVSYLDHCVRTAAGWRIARRELTVLRIEKRPVG